MGCCASSEEPPVEHVEQAAEFENPEALHQADPTDVKVTMMHAEAKAVEAGPERHTFLWSVLTARQEQSDNAEVMEDCCTRLQGHNKKLKSLISTSDAHAIKEALVDGGFLGKGINHNKLIAVLCTRTKTQINTTFKRYRNIFDRDMRDDVASEAGGAYGKMMSFTMTTKPGYVADMIDAACQGWGCDEAMLIEVFVLCEQAWLREGKEQWEGRTDKSLIDYLNSNLGSSYKQLCKLLKLLLCQERADDSADVDAPDYAAQCAAIHEQVAGVSFSFGDEHYDVIIDIIGKNSPAQNRKLAIEYENEYGESLRKGITSRASDKIGTCVISLLMPRAEFVAMRLKAALDKWWTDKSALCRLLGGLDGKSMEGVLDAFEKKYTQPFDSKLRELKESHFAVAALTWIRTIDDPTSGMEDTTEQEVSSLSGDAEKLASMCDMLLVEHESLMRFAAHVDMETLAEAIEGHATDDTVFIRTLSSRSKRFLGRLSYLYRETYDKSLSTLVDENLEKGWYAYLAKFLVLEPSQADRLLLDLALGIADGEAEDDAKVDCPALVEFLCARHPRRVRAAKRAWQRRNDAELIDRLNLLLETHPELLEIAKQMLQGKRDVDDDNEDHADQARAADQAKALHDDIKEAITILCTNSPVQNAAIALSYEHQFGRSLNFAIGEEFSGHVKNACQALIRVDPAEWYAQRLKASFGNVGKSERTVCRIIGAHDKAEIARIAKAYDSKYEVSLVSDINKHCKGDYKRLAVAWIDLPDQLEQPQTLIELPAVSVEVDAAADEQVPEAHDEEPSDDEDVDGEDLPDPSSAMYKAKVLQFQRRLADAESAGKERKVQYYRRLLTMYPPVPSGHKILREYIEALTAEYKNGDGGMVRAWIDALADSAFEEVSISKETFDEWQNTSEALVRQKLISIGELKHAWGVAKPRAPEVPDEPKESERASRVSEPAPPAPVALGMAAAPQMQVMQPIMQPMMQPMMPMMQPMQNTFQTVQTTYQQTILQPQVAGVQKMAATVPFGMYGGMQMTVNTPHGQMRVTIPPGYGPGSSFTFNVPTAGGGMYSM